jgi:hypothetical protein
LFQELAPAVQLAIDKFMREFQEFKVPPATFMLAGITARAESARSSSAKRGISHLFYFSGPYQLPCCLIYSLFEPSFWSSLWEG